MRRDRFSFRSCASSSRSAAVNPVLPFVRSARACLTHFPNGDSVRSRSRATWATVLPSSSTKRTAPALNSSVKLRRSRFDSAIVDTISTSPVVSKKSGQAHRSTARFRAR